MTAPLPQDGRHSTHEVRIEDGRFAHAACTCGWRTAGRRDRRVIRAEARDHALLYAGTASVTEVARTGDAAGPRPTTRTAS